MFVLDTNILVAALWSRRGASFQLLSHAVAGRLPVAVSVALALEYEAVLKRAEFVEAGWADVPSLDAVLDAFLAAARLVMPIRTRMRPSPPDPADEMVLECAVQAGAEAIVTLDQRDFRAAAALYRVALLKPGELLDHLNREEGK